VETIEVFLLGCWLYVFPFLDCVFWQQRTPSAPWSVVANCQQQNADRKRRKTIAYKLKIEYS
jgi:hypothetical protein